jgi:asparagine synthetase B (glutamine-hydrolysing)
VDREGVRLSRYWQRTFSRPALGAQGRASTAQPIDGRSVAEIVSSAVVRHLSRFDRPILALSGGLDSRLILAAARRAGLNPPAVTWGFDRFDTPEADFATGRRAAEIETIAHRVRRIDVDQFPRHAERVVALTDGLAGHIGVYPEADAVARELAAEHDAMIVGNEMFGWSGPARSVGHALWQVGIYAGNDLRWMRFLLRRQAAAEVCGDYLRQRRALVEDISFDGPDDLKDILYWRNRYPRLLASQSVMYSNHLAYVSPLLDAEVMAMTSRLTPSQRWNKNHMARSAAEAFPEHFVLPLNAKHSRTDWRSRLKTLGPTPRFIVETLLAPHAGFDEWFDRTRVRAWLGQVVAEAGAFEWPTTASAGSRFWSGALLLPLRPTLKARQVINLLTLKLWFHLFA